MGNLRIYSYNCEGVKSSIGNITQPCHTHDCLLIQEHCLYNDELCLFNKFHPDCIIFGVPPMDLSDRIISGRPYDGVGITWREIPGMKCEVITYDDNTILGLDVKYNKYHLLLICVYFPFQSATNYESITLESDTPHAYVLGDFNANLKCDSTFGEELQDLCHNNVFVYLIKCFCLVTRLIISVMLMGPRLGWTIV